MDSPGATAQSGGLPHSDIRGSPGARPSPRLFAACHVLHRLSVPRHPPDALLVLRPRPAPNTQDQRSDDRGQMSDHPCRPPCAIRDRCANGSPLPMLAHRQHAYPCSRPDLTPPERRWPDLLHGHDSLHDFNRAQDRRRDDQTVRRTRSPSQLAVPTPADAPRDFLSFSVLRPRSSAPGGPGPS